MASREVEAALAALRQQASTADETELDPIGVPPGFVAQLPPPARWRGWGGDGVEVEPRYYEGADWAPASLPGPKIADLQRRLAAAGLLEEYVNGVWDEPSRQAFRALLTESNAAGLTYDQMANRRANATAEQRKEKVAARLRPDPATLRQNAKAFMKSSVGREPTDDELSHLTGVLDTIDRQAYEAKAAQEQGAIDALAAGEPAPGGQNVDPQARFEEYLADRYKPEIQMRQGVADLSTSRENLMGSIFAIDQAIGA